MEVNLSTSTMCPRFACEEVVANNDTLMAEAIQIMKRGTPDNFLDWLHETNAHYIVDSSGNTLLHWAAALGNLPAVETLLAVRVCPNARNAMGATALLCAAACSGSPGQVVETLIHRGGSDPHSQNYRGESMHTFFTQRNLNNNHGFHGNCDGLDLDFRDKQSLGTGAALGPPAYYVSHCYDTNPHGNQASAITEEVEVEMQGDGEMTITVTEEVHEWPAEGLGTRRPSRYDETVLSTSYEVMGANSSSVQYAASPHYLAPNAGEHSHAVCGAGHLPSPYAQAVSPVLSNKAPDRKVIQSVPYKSLDNLRSSRLQPLVAAPRMEEIPGSASTHFSPKGSQKEGLRTSQNQSSVTQLASVSNLAREPQRTASATATPHAYVHEVQSSQRLPSAHPQVASVSVSMLEPSRSLTSNSASSPAVQQKLSGPQLHASQPELQSGHASLEESPWRASLKQTPQEYTVKRENSRQLEKSQSHLGCNPEPVKELARMSSIKPCPEGCNAAIQRALFFSGSASRGSGTVPLQASSSGSVLKKSTDPAGGVEERTSQTKYSSSPMGSSSNLFQHPLRAVSTQGLPHSKERHRQNTNVLQTSQSQVEVMEGGIRESPREESVPLAPHAYNHEVQRSQHLQAPPGELRSVSKYMQEESQLGSTKLHDMCPPREECYPPETERSKKTNSVDSSAKSKSSSKILEKIKWSQINPYSSSSTTARSEEQDTRPTLKKLLQEQAKMFEKDPLPPLTRTRKLQDRISDKPSRHAGSAYKPLPTAMGSRARATAVAKAKRGPLLPASSRVPTATMNPAPVILQNDTKEEATFPSSNSSKVQEECVGTVVIHNTEDAERLATPFRELQKTLIACATYLASHPPEGTDVNAPEYTTTLTARVTSTTTTTTTTTDGNTAQELQHAEQGEAPAHIIAITRGDSVPLSEHATSFAKNSTSSIPIQGVTSSPAPNMDAKQRLPPPNASACSMASSAADVESASYSRMHQCLTKPSVESSVLVTPVEIPAACNAPIRVKKAELDGSGSTSASNCFKSASKSNSFPPAENSTSKKDPIISSGKEAKLSTSIPSSNTVDSNETAKASSGTISSNDVSRTSAASASSSMLGRAKQQDSVPPPQESSLIASALPPVDYSKGVQFPSPTFSRPQSTQPTACSESPTFHNAASPMRNSSTGTSGETSAPSSSIHHLPSIPKVTNHSSSSPLVLWSGLAPGAESSVSQKSGNPSRGAAQPLPPLTSPQGEGVAPLASFAQPPSQESAAPPQRRATGCLASAPMPGSSEYASISEINRCSMMAQDNGSRPLLGMPSNSRSTSLSKNTMASPVTISKLQKQPALPVAASSLPPLHTSVKEKNKSASDGALASMSSMKSQQGVGRSFAQLPPTQQLPSAFVTKERPSSQKGEPTQKNEVESEHSRHSQQPLPPPREEEDPDSPSSPSVIYLPLLKGKHNHPPGTHCDIPARILHMFLDSEGGYVPKNLRPEYLHGKSIVRKDEKPQKCRTTLSLQFQCEHTTD